MGGWLFESFRDKGDRTHGQIADFKGTGPDSVTCELRDVFYLRRSMQVYMSILSFLLPLKRLKEAFRTHTKTGTGVVEAT